MFNSNIFKERLRKTREELKITQEDFAKRVGMARASASYYENTKNDALPNVEVLYKMCEVLDVSPQFLMGTTDVKTNKIDDMGICENLGLSVKAVEMVRQMKERNDYQWLLNTLIYMMEYESFSYFVATVTDYINIDNDSEMPFSSRVGQIHNAGEIKYKDVYRLDMEKAFRDMIEKISEKHQSNLGNAEIDENHKLIKGIFDDRIWFRFIYGWNNEGKINDEDFEKIVTDMRKGDYSYYITAHRKDE